MLYNNLKQSIRILLTLTFLITSILPMRTAFANVDDWVDIHIQHIAFKRSGEDLDDVADFKFYIVAKFENSRNYDSILTYPHEGSIELKRGDDGFFQITTENTGMSLSVPADVDTITLEVIVVDSDAIKFDSPVLNAVVDDALTQLPEWLAGLLKTHKNRIIKFVGRVIGSLGAVAYDYIAEEDKLGVANLSLSRQNGWIPVDYPVASVNEPGPMTVVYEIRVAPATDITQAPLTGRNLWLVNHCPKPLRFLLQFYSATDGWINTGWWEIAGDWSGYLQRHDATPLQADSDTFYYYAELLDGSGYTWEGDVAIDVDGDTRLMREVVLSPDIDNDYVLTLDCDDLVSAAISDPVTNGTTPMQPSDTLLSSRYMVETILFATTIVELLSSVDPAVLSGFPKRTPITEEQSIEYMSALVEEVWGEWVDIANQHSIDPKTADPALYGGLSPVRQLMIRMIQNKQGTLNGAEICALYHIFTLPEGATAPGEDIDGIIYSTNESCF